ncbi:AAA family ATPase [Actinocorallia longicatena]|uniref:Pilus assembly protein CpaE n=1 Tax=Actinocorallia longicatena TaxID=111803 RepID=A0ABP6QGY1_9ACTN
MPIICEPDENAARRLSAGFREHGRVLPDLRAVAEALAADPAEAVVVVGPGVDLRAVLAFAAARRGDRPDLGIVLVRERLDVGVMGEAMRAGIREVIADRDFPALMDACRRCWEVSQEVQAGRRAAAPVAAGKDGQVVVVFAAKGGCGKSTISTNLAVALAADGRHQVCLVDLDLAFGDVAILLRLTPQRTIVDAIPMVGRMDEVGVHSMLVKHDSGLATVLAPVSPGEAEKVSGALVTELLGVLKKMFDVVIVDTPSQLSEHVLAAMDVADRHLLLAAPEVTALKGLRVTLDMLELLGYPASARTFLINRADIRAGLSMADMERVIGARVAVHVPHSQDVSGSINRGVPMVLESPGHPVSQAVRQAAGVIVDGAAAVEQRGRFRRGRAARR